MIIAIDGPVAGGKSTAAKNLAKALGFEHLDTGALYRAVTLLAVRSKADPADAKAAKALLKSTRVRLDGGKVFLDDEDVSDAIRRPEVSSSVRPFAENGDVRNFVNSYARAFAGGRNVVVEGRDMGTVVFPHADLKLFLTASIEERARRRWEELEKRGTPQPLETVAAELQKRDAQDMSRAIAPLRMADDAVKVDSTGWSAEQTLDALLMIARKRLKGL
jgi:CMP/dCMP kinase